MHVVIYVLCVSVFSVIVFQFKHTFQIKVDNTVTLDLLIFVTFLVLVNVHGVTDGAA